MPIPAITARFNSTCSLCHHTIWAGNDTELGDEIVQIEGKWVHAGCASDEGLLDEDEVTSGAGRPD